MKKLITIFSILVCLHLNAQIITTFAGNGTSGYGGDGGQATAAQLNRPISVAAGNKGNIYIADYNNNRVRMINANGIISTIAGNGTAGYTGDGGQATNASFNNPVSFTFDNNGNLYIADEFNNAVRKIDRRGIITTVVGTGNSGYSGDGGQASAAQLYYPAGVTLDEVGNLYIADYYNNAVRKVNLTTGIITTVAGNGTPGYSGDGGLATAATLNQPWGIDIDAQGNIYTADYNNNAIRKIDTAGIITTLAGNGTAGYTGDGGLATAAELNQPSGIVVDAIGNIYIPDAGNDVIRRINTAGIINTIAGNGTAGYSGDGGIATAAQLNLPYDVTLAVDASNNLYIADFGNSVIRKIAPAIKQKTQGDDLNYCFNLVGPYTSPDPFDMEVCDVPDNNDGSSCDYKTTQIKISYNNSSLSGASFPSFKVTIEEITGTPPNAVSTCNMGSIIVNYLKFGTYDGVSGSFHFETDIATCTSGGHYSVTLESINYGATHNITNAKNFPFSIDISGDYNCKDGERKPTCSSQDFSLTFDYPVITDLAGNLGPFQECPGHPVTLEVQGMESVASYDWVYPNGSAHSYNSQIATNTPGSYYVLLMTTGYDNKECNGIGLGMASNSVLVQATTIPSVNVGHSASTICAGDQITLSVIGGTAASYQWSGGGINSTQSILTVNPLVTTTYQLVASNGGGCSEAPIQTLITVNPKPDFKVTSNLNAPTFCPGSAPVRLTAAPNGAGNYSYSWATSTNPNISIGTGSVYNATPNSATTYICTATDITSFCTTMPIPITIPVPADFTPAVITVPYGSQCENGYVPIFSAAYTNQNYIWSANNGATLSYPNAGIDYGQTVAVNCSQATSDITLTLQTTSTIYGCASTTHILIKQCCKAGKTTVHAVNNNLGTPSDPKNPTYTYLPNANLTNYVPTTNYYVTGQLVFQGNSTISGVNLIMNPGSSITVDGGATLNIINSHIYACSDMWQGINFNTFATQYPQYAVGGTPKLNITNSLIEDAQYGVNIGYSGFAKNYFEANTPATHPIVNLNNAWFNRCAVGVMADYDPLHPDSATNAVNNYTQHQYFNSGVITANSCVFSCLNGITMSRVTSSNYNTAGLTADYLHNYFYKPNFYTFCGIATNGSSLVNNTIKNCYFDNLVDGIVTYNNPNNLTGDPDPYTPVTSNLNVTSCTFQRAHLDPNSENYNLINNFAYAVNNYTNGYYLGGAYYYPFSSQNTSYSTGGAGAGINFAGSQLNVGGSSATACTFTNCDYGILALPDGGSTVNIINNTFKGTTKSGVYMSDGATISQPVTIASNTFKDHFQQGINLKFLGYYDNSNINVANNNFTISYGINGFGTYFQNFFQNPATFVYAPQAISITSFGLNGVPPANGGNYTSFNINNNTIHNYEKGIRSYNAYYTNIQDNIIDGMPDDAQPNYTYGISLTNCNHSTIISNTVKAEFGQGTQWMYGQFGVFTENSANTQILCNNINGPDVSLKCQGSNNVCNIEGNAFNNAAPINFWLDVSGYVGQQGSASLATSNTFARDNTFGSALLATNGSNANPNSKSVFYYINHGTQIPLPSTDDHNNIPSPTFPGLAISTGGVYALSTHANYYKCAARRGASPILNAVTAQPIAQNAMQFSSNNATAVYGNQKDLYRTLVDTGAAFYNADPILSTYMTSMIGSSHEKLLATDTLLVKAGSDSIKINQALTINNSFVPAGKHDAYLQKINNLYAAYKKSKKRLNANKIQDVRTIALLCPYEYGEGVYKARALLSLFDTLNYVNACEILTPPVTNNNNSRMVATENVVVSEQSIKVYPNPAQNNLYIEGLKLQGADVAELQVFNGLGQLVVKSKLNNGITPIEIGSLNSGSYFYKVLQNNNVILLDKLIILK